MNYFKRTLAAPILTIGLALCTSQAFAVNYQWTDSNGTSWFTPTNWTPNTPVGGPTATDNAHIGNALLASGLARIATPGATANNVFLGDSLGQSGELRIVNGGSLVTTKDFDVGEGGNGTALLADNSSTTVGINVNIADLAGSTGDMTVRDNAILAVTNNLRIGTAGAGTLTIRNFAAVSATTVNAGVLAGSNGAIDVSGDPGVFTFNLASTNNTGIGDAGTGSMDVHDGGIVVTSNNGVLGNAVSGIGTVTVRGENSGQQSIWQIGNNLAVGNNGIGDLEVHNGGEVDVANTAVIGRFAGSVGTVLVEGAGATSGTPSIFSVGNNLFVGGDAGGPGGQGELIIKNGGVGNVTNNMTVWGPGTGDRGTLSVDSTYILNVGGTLSFVGGRLNFLGDGVDFINDATLTNAPGPDQNGMFANVSDGNTATLDGLLSGNGHLVKTGTGTLILNNNGNTYSGGTNIDNGTLVVGAPSTGLNSVFGAGDVNLNGDINTRLRTREGVPTFYFVFGNFNANTGQLYTQVGGTNSGIDSDEMGVVGAANLDSANSHLFVHRINNYNPNNGDVVTIIDTLGGVFGQFSDAPPNAPAPNDFLGLIQPFAVYNADTVDLDFAFAASFLSVAKTPNQIATAAALDAAVAAGCIVPATNVLGNIPIPSLRHIYDLIAPEELASMYEASFAQSMVTSLNLQHRMDDIRWGSTGFCADGFVIQDNHGYTKNDGKSVADKNPAVEQTAPPSYRWGGFITGSGELTKTGDESLNDPGAAGYQLNEAGFTMGVDYRVTDHWAIGLSGAYSHTTGDLVDNGRLNTDGGKMGLYTTWGSGGFYVDAAASGGWNQYDTRRSAFLGQETGSTDGAEFNAMVAAGYDWKKGCWTFGPTASFEYTYVEFNSFTESDTSLIPLHFPDQNQEAYRSNLGFRIAHEQVMKPGEGLTVVPELRASWRHDFGPGAYAIDSNFVGCDDIFTVHGPWVGRDSAVVDLGLTAYCTPGLSAYIFYDGQFGRDNYNNNAISGGFRVAF